MDTVKYRAKEEGVEIDTPVVTYRSMTGNEASPRTGIVGDGEVHFYTLLFPVSATKGDCPLPPAVRLRKKDGVVSIYKRALDHAEDHLPTNDMVIFGSAGFTPVSFPVDLQEPKWKGTARVIADRHGSNILNTFPHV